MSKGGERVKQSIFSHDLLCICRNFSLFKFLLNLKTTSKQNKTKQFEDDKIKIHKSFLYQSAFYLL